MLAEVAATIADSGSNIEQVEVLGRHEDCSVLTFLIQVKDRKHLARIMRDVQQHAERRSRRDNVTAPEKAEGRTMSKKAIHSDSAPAAIGTYSQAIDGGPRIPVRPDSPRPATMEIVEGDFEARARQVFDNLAAVAAAQPAAASTTPSS